MPKRFIIIVTLSMGWFAYYVTAQDTVYISLKQAIDFLEKNNVNYVNNKLQERYNYLTQEKERKGLKQTTIAYQYGQLYTPDRGWRLDITQELGNLARTKQLNNSNYIHGQLRETENTLEQRMIQLEMMSVYYEWLYKINLAENFGLLENYFAKSLHVSGIRRELGETGPLEELQARTWVSEVETQRIENEISINILRNQLKTILNAKAYLEPFSRGLKLHMVDKPHDTTAYTANVITDVFKRRYEHSVQQVRINKSEYYPELSAGIFVQDINGLGNFKGVKANISFPLWVLPLKDKVKQSAVQSTVEKNRYLQQIENSKIEIENLIFSLDKCFIRIRHFQNTAVPLANLKLSTAVSQYKSEEIEYEEYLRKISEAMHTKREYLKYMNEYNQTAIKLELYLD